MYDTHYYHDLSHVRNYSIDIIIILHLYHSSSQFVNFIDTIHDENLRALRFNSTDEMATQ